jgi:hypothetical protein
VSFVPVVDISADPGGHLIEHGGGLTDAMVFGRIAGEQAASRSQ